MTHTILISPSEKIITQSTSENAVNLLKKNKFIQIAVVDAMNLKFWTDPNNKFTYVSGKDLVSRYRT